MARFQGPLNCDTGNPDGHYFVSAMEGVLASGAASTVYANGSAGSYFVTIPASNAASFIIPLSLMRFRYGVQDQLQEQFGSNRAGGAQGNAVGSFTTASTAATTAGINVSFTVLSTVGFVAGTAVLVDSVASGVQEYANIVSITSATVMVLNKLVNAHAAGAWIAAGAFTTPASITGFPPFKAATQFTPVTTPRPKGILFKQIYPVYTNLGAVVTSSTIGLYGTTINPNNAARTVNAIIPVAQNGMNLAVTAQPNITPITVPLANQIYQNTKYTEFYIAWTVTTSGSGTVALDGVFIDATFNDN